MKEKSARIALAYCARRRVLKTQTELSNTRDHIQQTRAVIGQTEDVIRRNDYLLRTISKALTGAEDVPEATQL
jgi:hypothetical protein